MGTLHQDLFAYMIISRSVLHRTRNVSDKCRVENQNTHLTFNNFFFRKSCRLWDNLQNTVRLDRHRWQTIRRRKDAFFTPDNQGKTPDKHPCYLILIPISRQQRLRERASMLRCTTLPVLLNVDNSYRTSSRTLEPLKIRALGCFRNSEGYNICSALILLLLAIQELPVQLLICILTLKTLN